MFKRKAERETTSWCPFLSPSNWHNSPREVSMEDAASYPEVGAVRAGNTASFSAPVWLGHILFTWMEFLKKTFEVAVGVKTLGAILRHLYQKTALSPQRHWRTLAKNIMYFCDLFHQSWWQWRKLFRHDLLTWLFSKLCTAHIRSIDLSADKVGWYD